MSSWHGYKAQGQLCLLNVYRKRMSRVKIRHVSNAIQSMYFPLFLSRKTTTEKNKKTCQSTRSVSQTRCKRTQFPHVYPDRSAFLQNVSIVPHIAARIFDYKLLGDADFKLLLPTSIRNVNSSGR
jgi:hypothetical protein